MGKVLGMGGKDQPKTQVKIDLNDLPINLSWLYVGIITEISGLLINIYS